MLRTERFRIILFGLTAGLGAGLLFLVQPMVARLLLPGYGGAPMVWTSSSLFFQVLLVASYGYSHVSTKWAGRRQPWFHLALLALVLLALPIVLPMQAAPPDGANPVLWLLWTLAKLIGIPFAVIATTGPLMQRWFAWTGGPRAKDPYFLFAASNLGSFGGLLAYPFIVEPNLTLGQQRTLWSVGAVVYVVLVIACGAVVLRVRARSGLRIDAEVSPGPASAGDEVVTPLGRRRMVKWLALAMLPSSVMLAVTSHLSTDVAAIPLLWVVPLAIYLATFVAAFARKSRAAPAGALVVSAGLAVLVAVLSLAPGLVPTTYLILVHLALTASVGYAAHSRLAGDRPPAEQLTTFYLVVAIGGACGGLLNGLVAPLVFDRVLEYPIVIVATPLLLAGVGAVTGSRFTTRLAGSGFGPRLTVAIATVFLVTTLNGSSAVIHRSRTFFGSYRVEKFMGDTRHELIHGTTVHGTQWRDARRTIPTTYYATSGPLGDVFDLVEKHDLKRVGAVGLGAGTLAAYGRTGQHFTFFEIDQAMVDIAENPRLFTYLGDSKADIDIEVGDGRLRLEATPDASFDLLVLDAFSSDAIPIHLLTQEALDGYATKLADDGFIAFHISNHRFDLEPVLAASAKELGWKAAFGWGVWDDVGGSPSAWVVMGKDASIVDALVKRPRWRAVDLDRTITWTDDYASVLRVLR